MERDNFYLLLELSLEPPETNDEVIWEAIQKKKAEWSRLRNHPTKGLQAQKYIGLIPEIQRVMMYNDFRQKEAIDAIQILKKGKADKYVEIDRHIDILLGKGFVDKEEIAKLAQVHQIDENDIEHRIQLKIDEKYKQVDQEISIRLAKGYITEAELSKIAGRHSLKLEEIHQRVKCPIAKDDKEKIAPPRPLEKTIEKTILDNLKVIKKTSLYDFLDTPVCSDLKMLQGKSALKKKELLNLSKKDADVTAGNILAGHCLTIFKNDESRYAYDVSLANARLSSLYSDIDMATIEGSVRSEYFDILVQKAMEFGMDSDDAAELVKFYCKSKNYQIEIKEKETTEKITKKPALTKPIIGAAAAVVIIILAVIVFFQHKKSSISSEYQAMIEKVEKQSSPEEKEKLLREYLDTHRQKNKFTQEATARIEQIKAQTINGSFDKVIKDADKLIQNQDYEKALSVYQAYLNTNPPEDKKKQINENINKLSEQMENRDFDKVNSVAITGEPNQKIAAFQEYLKKHPDGSHKAQVENAVKEMSAEYFIFVRKKLAACEQSQDWQCCVDLCKSYINTYDNSNSDQIKQLLPSFEEKIHYEAVFANLMEKANQLGSNYAAARQVFKDYLAAYPEAPIKLKIQAEIAKLNELSAIDAVNGEKTKIRNLLAKAGGRFAEKTDGVTVDSKTGLMWCLVDGRTAKPNTCLNYEEAKKYIENLKIGEYKDWRLPTPGELAGIYKSAQPFPSLSPNEWYWTSENYTSYSDGWHIKVSTLGRENNGQWESQQKDAKECGNVRAVRGK